MSDISLMRAVVLCELTLAAILQKRSKEIEKTTAVVRLLPAVLTAFVLVLFGFGESLSTSLKAQNFNSAGLTGAALNNPTSLQFGPDGRLYVSQQDGTIKAFSVVKSGANYTVTANRDHQRSEAGA